MKTTNIVLVFLVLIAVSANAQDFNLREAGKKVSNWIRRKIDEAQNNTVTPLENATSGSVTRMCGWFKVKVIGTGETCFSKQYQFGLSNTEQFGDYATSDGFINFFGEPECERGAVGIAWGFIRANVVAAAYERGRDCLSTVISAVVRDPFHQFSWGNVGVRISGEAVGEAVALCET